MTDVVYDDNGKITSAKYTVQLKAVYLDVEAATPTHITFYANGGTVKSGITLPEGTVKGSNSESITYPSLQINGAIAVLGDAEFEREGFTFVGWAKVGEPEGAFYIDEEDGKAKVDDTKYSVAQKPELWLKLNSDGTYTEVGTTNTEVKEVAADEVLPYDALYAVWEKTFYVLHSATGKVEAITINTEPFDLTGIVTEGNIYGGYYKAYGAATVSADNKAAALAADDHMAEVTDEVYDGSSLTTEAGTKFWVRANAYQAANNDAKGTELVPVADEVYYLKEVPAAYLSNNMKYIYTLETGVVTDIYLLTTVDDNLYKEVRFNVEIEDSKTAKKVTLVNKVAIQQRGLAGDAGTVTYYTAEKVNSGITRGYIGYVKNNAIISGGNVITLTPSWITLDGVEIGGAGKIYTIDEDCINITVKAVPTTPTTEG